MKSALLLSLTLPLFAQAELKFERQVIDDKISIGYGVVTGDVDGDGKPDIILADSNAIVWYKNPTWEKIQITGKLTLRDHVCLAARDTDGDGKVEIAVGAQWNPGETRDEEQSGAVFFLQRPQKESEKWLAIPLPHEPTVHRMRWVKRKDGKFVLVVVPLHGRGNKDGQGEGSKVLAYEKPDDPSKPWPTSIVNDTMHLVHNLDIYEAPLADVIYLCGLEGMHSNIWADGKWSNRPILKGNDIATGEARNVKFGEKQTITFIQPMHGNRVRFDWRGGTKMLDESLNQGHALGLADLTSDGKPTVVAGWREKDKDGKTGIRLYHPATEDYAGDWTTTMLDDQIACEDLQIADLNADGKPDIIASGRATKNVVIYWNRGK